MGSHSITSISYRLKNDLERNRHCVEVSFLFNGKRTKRAIYFSKNERINYLNEAKKIIESENRDGKLAKYAKKYHKKSFGISKLAVIAIVAVAGAVALGGLFTWKYLNTDHTINPREGEEVKVETEVSDPSGKSHKIKLTNEGAVVGSNYLTDIILEGENATTIALPLELDRVVSLDQELTKEQYAYDFVNNTTGKLMIPAEYVRGPVSIALTLRDVGITVTMEVLSITRCSVSYQGQKLKNGDVHGSFPTSTTEFIIESIDPCYALDNNCFDLRYKDGSQVSHSYKEIGSKRSLTIDAVSDFTFAVIAVPAKDAVMATATYNSKCSGIYYLFNARAIEIKKDNSIPVIPTSAKEIQFGVTSDDDITKPSLLEISCDLQGVVIKNDGKIPIGSDFIEVITLDCSKCPSIEDFTLNVHPEEYNQISATITQTNCTKVTHNGEQVTYDKPFLVTPQKMDISKEVEVVFEVTTSGALLTKDNIDCSLTSRVELIKNNTYKVEVLILDTTKQFDISINPETPLTSTNVTIEHNEHCSVMYHGVPVPSTEFSVIPVHDGLNDKVVFEAYPRDGTELNNNNVWISDNLMLVDGTKVLVEKINENEVHYQITISVVHKEVGVFEDFTLYINPGETRSPLLTITHGEESLIEEKYQVYYYDKSGTKQLAQYNTPVKFYFETGKVRVIIEAADGYAMGKGSITAYLTDKPSITLPIRDFERKDEKTYEIVFLVESTIMRLRPNVTVDLLYLEAIKDLTVTATFNEGVKGVTFNGQTITEKDTSFNPFETLDESIKFTVDTAGIKLSNEGEKQVTIICPEDPEQTITVESVIKDDETNKYVVAVHAERISCWKNFTLSIKPLLDTSINTYKSGTLIDKAEVRHKFDYVGEESSPTPIVYQRGVYVYEFTISTGYGYKAEPTDTEVYIHPKESTEAVPLVVTLKQYRTIYVTFESPEAKQLLNTDGIESIEIHNDVDAVPVIAKVNFDDDLYDIYTDYTGEAPLTSGQTINLGVGDEVPPTLDLYIKTDEPMVDNYVTISSYRTFYKSIQEYVGEKDYDYVITVSNIDYMSDTFDVNIGAPAWVTIDDTGFENYVTFADGKQEASVGIYVERVGVPYYLKEGYNRLYYDGEPTITGGLKIGSWGHDNYQVNYSLKTGQVFKSGVVITAPLRAYAANL